MTGTDALRASFFEECEDLLVRLGEGLTGMADSASEPEIETLHAVFRAVHSIKGGAAAFGLTSLVAFAHAFETALDLMRSRKLAAGATPMQSLLRAYDVLSDLVTVARDGGNEPALMQTVLDELDRLTGSDQENPIGTATDFDFQPVPLNLAALAGSAAEAAQAGYVIQFAPSASFYARGHEPTALLRALSRLGPLQVTPHTATIPLLGDFDIGAPALRWTAELATTLPISAVRDVFEFVDDLADLDITPLTARTPATVTQGLSSHDAAAQAPAPATPLPDPAPPTDGGNVVRFTPTIRVNLDRVDRLINQIGELVIMEAMLAQAAAHSGLRDDSKFVGSLDAIKQLAAAIQESVMSIRAQPLKPVFQRMQRIVREASDATGKRVRLNMAGETTEVDRTVIERLVDPLTHMVRNSVDHGIEPPSQRIARGKPAEGTITLSAAHRSGRVIIEVSDDGGGIDRNRIRDIAERRGLVTPGSQLGPAEVDNLLFMPGFSSRDEVSALSGRGVGLDVVRREIQALGGRVTINSMPGRGSTFTIALPLTLAVLEGMLIDVAGQTMVLPLSSIVETVQPGAARVRDLGGGGRLITNQGELIPIIDLAACFAFNRHSDPEDGILIVVETDAGRRAAFAVDTIHDQRQVVIKSLEDNCGTVRGISSATILGDGRVALIIDPEEIVQGRDAHSSPHGAAAHG